MHGHNETLGDSETILQHASQSTITASWLIYMLKLTYKYIFCPVSIFFAVFGRAGCHSC
jgi:hypothetical protein